MTNISRRAAVGALVTAPIAMPAILRAQGLSKPVRIGLLSDMGGPYRDVGGPGNRVAVEMAVADFGGSVLDRPIEVMQGDDQNKPDVAASLAREWVDNQGVDVLADGAASSSGLAIQQIAREKKRIYLITGPASSDMTGKQCSPYGVHFCYDTYALAHGTGASLTKAGGDTWFFITADYAFGYALERDATAVVEASGGKVLGRVRVPTNTNDFSSYLLQAQASKAKVIGLAIAGGDAINAIKQAGEFGIVKGGQNVAGLLLWASDVAALGLPTTQGVVLTEAWYWDMNDSSRAWTKRWQAERPGKVPTSAQAGVYSGVTHYLKTVEAMKSHTDGRAVAAKMKETPTDDVLYGKGMIRVDGRKIHDMHLFEIKKPGESKYFGDFYKLRATIPAAEAFRPLKDGGCPLVGG